MPTLTTVVLTALVVTSLSGCGQSEPEARAAAPAPPLAPGSGDSVPPQATGRACEMLPAAEVSTIVGQPMVGTADEGNGYTQCTFTTATGRTPSLDVKIEWGGGEAAMAATAFLGRLEPEMTTALDGVGDEATAIGPALMVRTGEDLVTLTLFGIDDEPSVARQVLARLRPRMGPSAQAASTGAAPGSPSRGTGAMPDEARGVLGGLLEALSGAADGGAGREPRGATAPKSGGEPADDPRAPEPPFAAFDGPRVSVPLVAGLTIVAARHEPGRGDYEPIVRVARVDAAGVATTYSANLPEGDRLEVPRTVRAEDLASARGYRAWFNEGDPEVFAGTTAFSLSRAVFEALARGDATLDRFGPSAGVDGLLGMLGGAPQGTSQRGTLTRVGRGLLGVPVLVNGQPITLPAVHARGTFGDEPLDFYVLDDSANPIVLRSAGRHAGQVTEIRYPEPVAAPRLEAALETERRVELHGIFFDFGRTTIRPESALAIGEIADVLRKHPDWSVTLEGHTDDVGGDSYNLDLSRRRAAAIEQALVKDHGIAAGRLRTEGFGAARPRASNETLSGRARNRRVEMVRR